MSSWWSPFRPAVLSIFFWPLFWVAIGKPAAINAAMSRTVIDFMQMAPLYAGCRFNCEMDGCMKLRSGGAAMEWAAGVSLRMPARKNPGEFDRDESGTIRRIVSRAAALQGFFVVWNAWEYASGCAVLRERIAGEADEARAALDDALLKEVRRLN